MKGTLIKVACAVVALCVAVVAPQAKFVETTEKGVLTFGTDSNNYTTITIERTVGQQLTRQIVFQDTLHNSDGWVYLDTLIAKADKWFVNILCDSCSSPHTLKVRQISDDDTLESYHEQLFSVYQPADSALADLISRVALYNPNPDTTAYGNEAECYWILMKAD